MKPRLYKECFWIHILIKEQELIRINFLYKDYAMKNTMH